MNSSSSSGFVFSLSSLDMVSLRVPLSRSSVIFCISTKHNNQRFNDSFSLKVCTLRAQSRNRARRVFRVGPEPERGEPAQGPNGVSGLLPPSSHEEALQLVRVDLLELVAGSWSQLQPDVLQTLRCCHSLVLERKFIKMFFQFVQSSKGLMSILNQHELVPVSYKSYYNVVV